jgi:hypothetical protein
LANLARTGLGVATAEIQQIDELADLISIIKYEFAELVVVQQDQLCPIQAQLQFSVKR